MHDELELVDQSELDGGVRAGGPPVCNRPPACALACGRWLPRSGGADDLGVPVDAVESLVTTYFLAPSMVRAKGRIQSSTQSAGSPAATGRQASIIW